MLDPWPGRCGLNPKEHITTSPYNEEALPDGCSTVQEFNCSRAIPAFQSFQTFNRFASFNAFGSSKFKVQGSMTTRR
jgi:hypothetical protein